MGTPPSIPRTPDECPHGMSPFRCLRCSTALGDAPAMTRQERTDLENNPATLKLQIKHLAARLDEVDARQMAIISALNHMVDQTDPACPIGVALTMAGLT